MILICLKEILIMNYTEALALLEKYSQTHVLKYYDELDEAGKANLLRQIESLDWTLPSLLERSEEETKRGKLEPLGALTVKDIESRRDEFEAAGIEALKAGKIGAVLLAGGQGTRLGHDGPKGTYRIGVNKELYIFECLINNMMKVVDRVGRFMHLYIMTSEINNEITVDFFKKHNYFGYDPEYVHFFVQEMAPAVSYDGKVLLEAKDRIAISPNGNGGWYRSLKLAGLVDHIKENGITHISTFAVDNVLQQINDPAFVGASLISNTDCCAKVIRKNDPEEKVGVLCLEDGHPSIVEYYEITDEMRNLRDEEGELVYTFGVILNYMFTISFLERTAKNGLSFHLVNKKVPYIDENGNKISPTEPNAIKFEQLILDMVHLTDTCLAYEIVREKEFAPVKNPTGVDSVESARELLVKNGVEI